MENSFVDVKQAVFEQLSLSDFVMWGLTALKTFNIYSMIMNSKTDNIRIS